MTVAFNLKNRLSGLFSVLFFKTKSYFWLENNKKSDYYKPLFLLHLLILSNVALTLKILPNLIPLK